MVLARHLARNYTVYYAYWWYGVAGATCTTIHTSEPASPSKKKKMGIALDLEQLDDTPLCGEPPSFLGGEGEEG